MDESLDNRGVFVLKHPKKILFTKEIVIDIDKLPKRKIHINFDPEDFGGLVDIDHTPDADRTTSKSLRS